jgi:hypothetical protein
MWRGSLPSELKLAWLCLAPFATLFAARVAWEKTILTWERGPQAVGFSMMHIHPMFFIVGVLCCFSIMLWLLPSAFYAIKRRQALSPLDGIMLVLSLLIAIAIVLPDRFFATHR